VTAITPGWASPDNRRPHLHTFGLPAAAAMMMMRARTTRLVNQFLPSPDPPRNYRGLITDLYIA
jgi:hypothetical protein